MMRVGSKDDDNEDDVEWMIDDDLNMVSLTVLAEQESVEEEEGLDREKSEKERRKKEEEREMVSCNIYELVIVKLMDREDEFGLVGFGSK